MGHLASRVSQWFLALTTIAAALAAVGLMGWRLFDRIATVLLRWLGTLDASTPPAVRAPVLDPVVVGLIALSVITGVTWTAIWRHRLNVLTPVRGGDGDDLHGPGTT